MKKYTFPDGFLWGTATSAHQIEGNNKNSDWWVWEHSKTSDSKYPLEPSDMACDSYNRYKEDFDLCKEFHNNAVRFSVEWARIEPRKGEFDPKEIEHYKKVIKAAKARGLKTFVTLHHFTNPIWFAEDGGWHGIKAVSYFSKYVCKCAEEFGDLVDAFITINEPQVYVLQGYYKGVWPPNKKNRILSLITQINMILAHRKAYKIINSVVDKPVGIAKNIVWYETDPFKSNFWDRITAAILDYLNDDVFLRPILGRLDFLGLNYYFTNRIRNFKVDNPSNYGSDLGWWINPGGLGNLLHKLKKYKIPIYVTENGLADSEDKLREHFIRDMLISCAVALQDGADLRGYFHWSLLDNYEWHEGFWPRFGLVEIDRENNLERKPRKSFSFYGEVCKNNSIDV